MHGHVGTSDVELGVKADLSVDELGYLPQTTELVNAVSEHVVSQLKLIDVFVEGKNFIVTTLDWALATGQSLS